MGVMGWPELLVMFVTFSGGTALIITLTYLVVRRASRTPGRGQRFCNRCGAASNLSQQNFCGNCGERLPDLMSRESKPMDGRPAPQLAPMDELATNRLEGPGSITERTTDLLD